MWRCITQYISFGSNVMGDKDVARLGMLLIGQAIDLHLIGVLFMIAADSTTFQTCGRFQQFSAGQPRAPWPWCSSSSFGSALVSLYCWHFESMVSTVDLWVVLEGD